MKFPFEVNYVLFSKGSVPSFCGISTTVVCAPDISSALDVFADSHKDDKYAVYGVSLCENQLETFKHNVTCA